MQSEKDAKNAVKNLLTMVPDYKFQKGKDPALLQIYIDDISRTLIPEIDFILPDSREQNAEEFTMSVKGSNFTYGSQVMIRGKGKTTTFISDSILLAKIPASDMLTDDEYEITVYSPILGGRISNSEKFEVKSSSFSFWSWIGLGTAVAVLVAAAIYLLKPDPDPIPIADPPGRP